MYENLNFKLPPAGIVGIIGPNGAGKTTLFKMIMNEENPDSGLFKVGETVKIGYVDQRHKSIDANQSIYEVISGGNDTIQIGGQSINSRAYVSKFNFNGADQQTKVGVLSGGERRRTEIARALATDPKFVLLDEPFAGVDPIAVEDIQKIISHLKKRNIGILITDHNVQETLAITDRTYLMFEGNILKSGKPEDLAKDEMVRKLYLGQNFEFRKKKLDYSS